MKTRKLLVFAACVIMLIAALCAASYAAEVVDSGTCGENLTWTLDSDGVLTISGEGAMTNYGKGDLPPSPWKADSIKLVIISDGVTRIGSSAFNNCTSLTSVTIPDSVSVIGRSAFGGCSSLMSIIIPDGVTAINDWVFYECTSLNSVKIPDGVTSIGEGAFQDCISLVSVTIPDSVNTIGNQAFFNCTGLKEIFFSGSEEQWKAIELDSNNELLASSTIHYNSTEPDTNIVDSGTCGENLTWTLDSDGVLTISGEGAMTRSPWRSNHSEKIKQVVIHEGVTTICSSAFESCEQLTNATIPDSVTIINTDAFWSCNSLKSITIPGSVTKIGGSAFAYCTSLSRIVIGNGVKEIGFGVFADCKSLTSVELPESVTIIGQQAFYRCISLSNIELSSGLTEIGSFAFSGCTSLSMIKFYGDYPSIHSSLNVFDDVTASAYYPANNPTWTYNTLQNYGGHITWVPYGDEPEPQPVEPTKNRAIFTADDITAKSGDTVTFNVYITENQGIAAGRIEFFCPQLSTISIRQGKWAVDEEGDRIGTWTYNEGENWYNWYYTSEISSEGVYCTYTVRVDGEPGTYDIQLIATDLAGVGIDENGEKYVISYKDGEYFPSQTYTATLTILPDDEPTPTPASADIITDTVTAYCGEGQTADVNISYVGEGSISSVRMVIDSALPIAGITSDYEFEYNEEDGWIIIWAKNGASFGESVLLTLHYDLDVDPAYDDGEYAIGIELIEVTDEDEKLIELTSQNGAVIIENPIKLGDVNMDGVVDNRDIIMIARYLVSLVPFDDDQMILADFNCDGIVNNTDLVLVSRYIVGLA